MRCAACGLPFEDGAELPDHQATVHGIVVTSGAATAPRPAPAPRGTSLRAPARGP